MLKKRGYKYTLELTDVNDPKSQRLALVKEVLRDSTFFPKPVEYRDIDEAFVEWVENDLKFVFEDSELPTYALFSNQRYSEYMQMWESMDDNNNLKLNFKVITRENNPKEGTLYGKKGNIPSREKILLKKVNALNDLGKVCCVEYRMSQPIAIDISYKLTVVTNKYNLLNEFNRIILNKFSSLQCYISPNGHMMPMKLRNIADESEYNVDDRQYFAQSYDILLMSYVISKEDFDIQVKPIVSLHSINMEGIERKKPNVEIEDLETNEFYNQPMKITIYYDGNKFVSDFKIDSNMMFTKIHGDNLRTYTLKVNDDITILEDEVRVNENDKISIKIKKINSLKDTTLYIEGYNPDIIYDKQDDIKESVLDEKNISQEIIIQ